MSNNMTVSGATQPVGDSLASAAIQVPLAKTRMLALNNLLRMQRDLAALKSGVLQARTASPAALPEMLSPSKPYSFATVDYPGAATTEVFDSNGGIDVGIFVVDPSTPHTQSFTRSGDVYQILNLPGSAGTLLVGINSPGMMAGAYNDLSNKLHGFVYNAGAITNVDFPGSTQTAVFGINEAGDIAGIWSDAANQIHGFMASAGVFSAIDHPSATLTEVTGINGSGQLVGIWEDASSVSHGFIWSNGVFTDIDFPGAKSTVTFGINDAGQVAGYYQDASSVFHGFLYENSFSIVDVAGAKDTLLTRVSNQGDLTGVFVDALNEDHGLRAH